MAGWGTKYSDRDALLEYLVANYGDDKPLPQPDMSGNGSAERVRGGPPRKGWFARGGLPLVTDSSPPTYGYSSIPPTPLSL